MGKTDRKESRENKLIMANEQNLKPYKKGQRSREEVVTNSRKGGIKSGEVRRANKLFKEIAQAMLSSELKQAEKDSVKAIFPDIDDDMLNQRAMILAVHVKKARKGDLRSAQWVQEVAGEQDAQKVELSGQLQPFTIERVYNKKQVKKEDE